MARQNTTRHLPELHRVKSIESVQSDKIICSFAPHLSAFRVRSFVRFVKDWALPIIMLSGIVSYFVFVRLPLPASVHHAANRVVAIVQPALLFCMLFISFCKIDPAKIRPRRWHLWLALIQAGAFIALSLVFRFVGNAEAQIVIQCAMICLICPTATAAVVITDKLGGNTLTLIAYTIISNMVTAVVVPAFIPFVNPAIGNSFWHSFFIIVKQIFPLLVFPFLLAWIVRLLFPKLLQLITSVKDLAFYLWMVALALALAVTTRALVHSGISALCFISILVITLICCVLQFFIGKRIGGRYNDRISGGQALGQKNTVFIIWTAYTFMNPVTAVAGGFYSIWHNTINSYQLYKKRKANTAAK